MPQALVTIVRLEDEAFPGFVMCKLVDAHGREHTFVEKAAVISTEDISARSAFPIAGWVACEIVSEHEDRTGRVLLRVDTTRPHGIESIDGDTIFELVVEQVSR